MNNEYFTMKNKTNLKKKNSSFRLNESEIYLSLYENYNETSMLSYENNVTIVLFIIFGLGMLLNSVSVLVIIKSKKLEPITILILNLVLADMVYISGISFFFWTNAL